MSDRSKFYGRVVDVERHLRHLLNKATKAGDIEEISKVASIMAVMGVLEKHVSREPFRVFVNAMWESIKEEDDEG